MRTLAMAAAALAILMALPAHAQMGGIGGKRNRSDEPKSEEKKSQVDDKAYKAALERIPDPKEKYDPWGVARPAAPDKTKPK